MRSQGFDAFTFSTKAAVAAVLAYFTYEALGLPGATWAPVSAVVVMHPSWSTSFKASMARFFANIIGALIGAGVTTWLGPTALAIATGVLLTGLACHYAYLDDSVRSAFASVVIVVLSSSSSVWYGSLDRVLAVVIGCAVALIVSMSADRYLLSWRKIILKDKDPADTAE